MMGVEYGKKYVVYDYSLIWQLAFCWFPARCHRSGKYLWLKHAYRGIHKVHGPGYNVNVAVWHHPYEHMKFILESA